MHVALVIAYVCTRTTNIGTHTNYTRRASVNSSQHIHSQAQYNGTCYDKSLHKLNKNGKNTSKLCTCTSTYTLHINCAHRDAANQQYFFAWFRARRMQSTESTPDCLGSMIHGSGFAGYRTISTVQVHNSLHTTKARAIICHNHNTRASVATNVCA